MSSRRRDRRGGGEQRGGGGGYELVREGRPSRQQQVRRAHERDEGAVMSRHQRPPTGSQMLFHAGRPPTGQRPAQPTIVEEPGPAPGRGGAVVVRQQQQGAFPWESKSVRTLAKKVGKRDPAAAPMMIEGREGTILAAVGEQADHEVATEVLKWHQAERKQAQAMLADQPQHEGGGEGGPLERVAAHGRRAQPRTLGRGGGDDGGGSGTRVVDGRRKAPADKPHPLDRRGAAQRGGGGGGLGNGRRGEHSTLAVHSDAPPFSFGAVYEHRDAFGVPRYVGETGEAPEIAFQADMEHKGVRKTVQGGGSSSVVWAGFGSGPVGAAQMSDMRKAVQHVRAERMQAAKLGGFKPYSAHGAMGIELD